MKDATADARARTRARARAPARTSCLIHGFIHSSTGARACPYDACPWCAEIPICVAHCTASACAELCSTNLLRLSSLGFASSSSASAAAVAPQSRQRHSARACTAPLRVISFAVNRAERCRRAAATTGAQGLQRTWVDECKNVSKCRVFVKDRDRVVEPAMRTQFCWHRVTLSVQGIPMRWDPLPSAWRRPISAGAWR